jgi:hypothetical protein
LDFFRVPMLFLYYIYNFLWYFCGIPMGFPWYIYWIPIIYLWNIYMISII